MISREEIQHLKNLARVEFSEDETEKLAKDLGAILGHVDELKEVDVSGILEMTHSVDLKNTFRKDENKKYDEKLVENLIESFPEKENLDHRIYLKVKSVF